MPLRILCWSFCLCLTFSINTRAAAEPVSIIFDTDMANDCDDAGALAVLNALADRGEANILAVVTNRKDSALASGAACDAINTFYNRPDILIGTDKDGAKVSWDSPSSYTPSLRDHFPHDSPSDDKLPDALDVYRKTLAAQPDKSVVICSVGALSNLDDLLNSLPDDSSELSGRELIEKKVKVCVIMGAAFPRSARPETNIKLDPPAAVAVTNNWPSPIIWQGYEVGAALHCGASLQQADPANPVRRAFELRPFLGGRSIDHGKPAHDQAAVILAVRGPQSDLWNISPYGQAIIDSEGHSEWRTSPKYKQRYVSIKGRTDQLTELIETLMTE